MRSFWIRVWLAIVAWGTCSVLEAAPIPTAPIHTNKLKFKIPFHYDAAELTRLGARQIQLHVSRDQGRTWQAYQEVTPDAGKFSFQAAGDGEYWFIVRTLDAKKKLQPAGKFTDPDLRVIVDTKPPTLQLELKQTTPGKAQLLWTASDEHLDLTQLRLEYLQPGSPDWQPVPIVPKAIGQTGWSLPQGGVVAVRGTVADLARNTGSDEVQLRVVPANQAVPRPDAPGLREPVAGSDSSPHDSMALTLPEKFPSSSASHAGVAPGDVLPGDRKPGDPFDVRGETALGNLQTGDGTSAVPPRQDRLVSLKPDHPPVIAGQSREPVPGQEGARQPVTARNRVVNSRRFQIGYKLQDVGPSGVSMVELYITEDDGRTWFHYGADDDKQSPIPVEVPREGIYGFTLGVQNGLGVASDPPQNGDRPAIVVAVDLTPPRLDLLSLEQGRGKNAGKVAIAWKCTDDFLSERPISLFYSPSGQAPWLPIAGPLENTGSYVWSPDPQLVSTFNLRIEARDLAGNLQTADSRQPVVLDLARPTAKITDVESPAADAIPRD